MTDVRQQRGLNAIKVYVPGKPIDKVRREYGLKDVIKLASNENSLGPSPKALAAIKERLSDLNLYPDVKSHNLLKALAEHLGIRPEQLTVGNGADGLIMQTCLAYLDEQSEVIVSQSSFPVYDIYTHVMRAVLVKIPLRNFQLDLEAMLRAISDKTKLIFVCNPNNPTGTIVTAVEVEAFMDKAPKHVLIIYDEAYYEFVDSPDYPDSLRYIRDGHTNTMIMRTFSKIYGLAGIRLGYAIAEPKILAPLNRVKEPFSVNLLAQAAGVAALEDQAFLEKTVTTNHAGRIYLYGEFERLRLPYVRSHTNFVLVKIGPQATAVQEMLLDKGVIVRPCAGYDLPLFLRVTVGSKTQNARFIEALESTLAGILGDVSMRRLEPLTKP
ncbi:MAG: histidinol-phosphate transaminase [Candidatus Bipolaricaulota bacterium]